MLSFELEIIAHDSEDMIDGLSRGHISIKGSKGLVTSKGKQPDQSMMIFLSVVEILDGIRHFMLDHYASTYNFVGVDSSFQFSVTKLEGDRIRLTGDQGIMDEVETTEMIQTIWKEISIFLSRYGSSIKSHDPVADDLVSAVDSFKGAFRLYS